VLAENCQQQASPRSVLVVEDEVLVRLMIAKELRDAGFSVFEAMNADEALAILHNTPDINLVMTDVIMPGSMDGVGLAAVVRSNWPELKVIVASGQAPRWPAPNLADGFFGKPYDPARVVRRVKELLADNDQ
jgi:CheY-like chemotaxis protein